MKPKTSANSTYTDGARRLRISPSIDALDPAYAPGTGTPEPGGPSGATSITAAAILFELLCVLAQARVRRRSNVTRPDV
jgi:arginase family enzyme